MTFCRSILTNAFDSWEPPMLTPTNKLRLARLAFIGLTMLAVVATLALEPYLPVLD